MLHHLEYVDSQRVSWDHPKRQQTMCNFDDFNHHFYFHRHLNCNSGLNVVSHVQKKDHCMKSSIVNKGVQLGGVVVQFSNLFANPNLFQHLADLVEKQLMEGMLQPDREGKSCLEHNSRQNSKEFSPTKAAFPF